MGMYPNKICFNNNGDLTSGSVKLDQRICTKKWKPSLVQAHPNRRHPRRLSQLRPLLVLPSLLEVATHWPTGTDSIVDNTAS